MHTCLNMYSCSFEYCLYIKILGRISNTMKVDNYICLVLLVIFPKTLISTRPWSMRSTRRSGIDTISNFPPQYFGRNLGCLSLKDAVKTSILSRYWGHMSRAWVWLSLFKSFAHAQEAKTILLLHKQSILRFKLKCSNLIRFPNTLRVNLGYKISFTLLPFYIPATYKEFGSSKLLSPPIYRNLTRNLRLEHRDPIPYPRWD